MIIEGRNAVTEALKGETTIEKVLLLKDSTNLNVKTIISLCREQKIPVQFVDRYALDRLSVTGDHRGYIAIATDFKYCDADEILEKKGKKSLLILLLDGLEDPHNFGAIIRVAECAGADQHLRFGGNVFLNAFEDAHGVAQREFFAAVEHHLCQFCQ